MEIELYSKMQNPIEAIDRIGEMFAKSGMFGCDRREQGQVLALACIAERKSPVQVLREYHIIDGKLADRADSMLAKFRAKGGKHKVISRTPEAATVELALDGQTLTFGLTWEECKAEPFVWSNKTDKEGKPLPKKNWATPRARMQTMWARVISDGVRAMAPEIVAGVYTPEEIEDTSSAAPAAPLLPPQPAAEPKPAKVVEVQTVPTTEPKPVNITVLPTETTAAGFFLDESKKQQPQPPPAATAKPFGPINVRLDPTGKRISDDTIAALENAIGVENAPAALEWLKAHNWITSSLADLNIERARRIIEKPDVFVGYVTKGAK